MIRYARYPSYKSSGIDWLRDVPTHWQVIRIKHLTPVKRGASPRPIDDPKYFDDEGEFAWVRIADVSASDRYLETTTQRLSEIGEKLSVKRWPGHLFLSIAGTVGKPIITKIKCCIHDGFVYFPDFKQNSEFLYYVFACGQPYLGLGKMGTQLNLNTDTVGSILMGLPPIEEQIAIVKFLDFKTAQIDALIAKKKSLLDKLAEKRTALITHAVTKGLDPSVPMKESGVTWLGEIPEHWKMTRLKYATSMIVDCPHDTPQYSVDGEFLVIRTADLLQGKLELARAYRVEEAEYRHRVRRAAVKQNDILYSREGERWGFAATVPAHPTMCLGQRMMQVRAGHHFHPRFLMWHLNVDCVYQQGALDTAGSTAPHVNVETIKNYWLVEPPLQEQIKIAAFVDRASGMADKQAGFVKQAIDRLSEYRSALITNAVTGKIDVREFQILQPAEGVDS